MVRVDIWSDIACPWCLVGVEHMKRASEAAGIPVEVEMHAYQLNPDMTETVPAMEHVTAKYGDAPHVQQMRERLESMGSEVGINFDFATSLSSNTFDGHRLHHFAKLKGKGDVAMTLLLEAQHTGGQEISSHAALQGIGEKAGLDGLEVAALLASNDHAESVTADMEAARQMNVTGVPFFVIDGKYGLSGAQPIEVMAEVLTKVRDEAAATQLS